MHVKVYLKNGPTLDATQYGDALIFDAGQPIPPQFSGGPRSENVYDLPGAVYHLQAQVRPADMVAPVEATGPQKSVRRLRMAA